MSQISLLIFFSPEKQLFIWTDLPKNTPRRTKRLKSPVWNKILTFWAHTNRCKMQQKLFQFFKVTTYSWGFWKKHRKGTAKATPKTAKICILYILYVYHIYREYLFYLQSNASDNFLQTCTNFVEQQLKFFHFEGSIIP